MSQTVETGLKCDDCGSSDAKALYDDGHTHCFSCKTTHQGHEHKAASTMSKGSLDLLPEGSYLDLRSRGISAATCRKMNYHIVKGRGQVANLYDAKGRLTGQKVRTKDKDFQVRGSLKESGMFGQYRPFTGGGKRIVIFEGEIDALSYVEATNGKWPAVSITGGAGSAKREISRNIEWLSTFEEVVLWFDDDEVGHKALEQCAPLFPPGKVKTCLADPGYKDCNDMLAAGKVEEILKVVWNAEKYTPAGLVTLKDIREQVMKPVEWGYPWPWEVLTNLTYGRREGEIYAFGAGTGIGKTDVFMTVIEQTVTDLGRPVGLFLLELEPNETGKRLAGKQAGKRFHVPDDGWTKEELAEALDALDPEGDKVHIFDHFGITDWDQIKGHIRYLVQAVGVKDIFLDHLTALAAGEDERIILERIMAEMGGLVKELKFTLYFVSHLATPEGKPHEEGGRVFIRHFKGSRSIGFWSHFMFGLERNQQAGEKERHLTTFRVLKDRYTGQGTGCTFTLKYHSETGQLEHVEEEADDWEDDADGY